MVLNTIDPKSVPQIAEERYGSEKVNNNVEYKLQIVWRNVILLGTLHLLVIHGFCQFLTDPNVDWRTPVATYLFGLFSSSLGITAGAHRLWSHRSYKAKWPLRLILAFANTMALQNDIYEWCRDHRVHHKHSETGKFVVINLFANRALVIHGHKMIFLAR